MNVKVKKFNQARVNSRRIRVNRYLVSDAYEWINEILTVPIYHLAKPQPRQQGAKKTRSVGKEDSVELESSLTL